MASEYEASSSDTIEMSAKQEQEETYVEGQYMEFYSDQPNGEQVSVPQRPAHGVPGGEAYAVAIPKEDRKKGVPEQAQNKTNVPRREGYKLVVDSQAESAGTYFSLKKSLISD